MGWDLPTWVSPPDLTGLALSGVLRQADYLHDYNYHRAHTSLKGASPMDTLDNLPKHLT